MSDPTGSRKWMICGVLLLATMLNYMDRQTLSLTITPISKELGLNNEQYGTLETCFGLAFAVGALVFGVIVDRFGVRLLYPFVFVVWSGFGIATAYSQGIGEWLLGLIRPMLDPEYAESVPPAYLGLMVCRTGLGLFESGHWPCALVTTSRLLSRADRSFGNSLLQSGASVGATLTPIVVQWTVNPTVAGSWKTPYVLIGIIGVSWVIPWFLLMASELAVRDESEDSASRTNSPEKGQQSATSPATAESDHDVVLNRCCRFLALVITVISINMTWQYFRIWLPKFLKEFHGYEDRVVNWFTSAYYIATDIGCIASGLFVKLLIRRGSQVHRSRLLTFTICGAVTALGIVAANLGKGPLLLGILLLVAAGSLGLFPNYYSFTQEISAKRQGLVTGILGALAWVVSSILQKYIGRSVDVHKSYRFAIQCVSILPLISAVAIALLWNVGRKRESDLSTGETA